MQGSQNETIAKEIREAQFNNKKLASQNAKVTDTLLKYNQDFEEFRLNEESLETYVKLDHFREKTYLKDATSREGHLGKARIRWNGPDTYTVNDKVKAMKHLFSDPDRLPTYDQEAGHWEFSEAFKLEQAEDDAPQIREPNSFMDEYI